MTYHNFMTGRSEFDVAESRLGWCSPIAWLRMLSTWTLRRACAPANCGGNFSRLRSIVRSYHTASSGGPIPRLFWSHPYQSPRLRRSSSPMRPRLILAARL